MTFPKITEEPCPTDGGNGDGDIPVLVLKPGVATGCAGSIQFKAFLQTPNSGETEIASGAVYQSSKSSVVVIDAVTGLATLVSAGQANITATYGDLQAQSVVTVQGTGADCCNDVVIATAVLVDDSKSMQLNLSSGWTRLDFAKAAAITFFNGTLWSKDTAGLIRFNAAPVTIQPISATAITATEVNTIGQTANQTNIEAALDQALLAVGAVTADRKVILLISDGEHRPIANGAIPDTAAIVAKAQTFKTGGGIIIAIGCAGSADGFSLLQAIATSGFFLNAYDDLTREQALASLLKMLCYYCAGMPENCCIGIPGEESLPIGASSATDDALTVSLNEAHIVRSYSISLPVTDPDRVLPTGLLLEGSNDFLAWTPLDTRASVTGLEDAAIRTFSVATPGSYLHYRITLSGPDPGDTKFTYLLVFNLSEMTTCTLTPAESQVPDPDPLPDLEISSEHLYTSTKTACAFCPLVGGEQTSAEGEAQITTNANRKIFNWDNPGTPSGCLVAESNLHVGAHYTLRGSASSLVGTINSGTVVVTGVVIIEGYLAFSIPDSGGFAFFQLDLLNIGPISTELVVTGASLAVYPSVQRCATRSASSYVDQATADAAALAAATAAAAALCGVSNNEDPITIPAIGSASPYPSVQVISDVTGTITKVVLKLYGLTHGSPDDLQILLVSPTGTKVKVWQNAGGLPPHGVTNIDVTLDDDAADPLPDDADIAAGEYQPAQYGVDISMNPPAPPLHYDTALSEFIGEDPNGSWSLYVMDDLSVFGGVITSWEVVITTA